MRWVAFAFVALVTSWGCFLTTTPSINCNAYKQQALVLLLSQQLIDAQLVRADRPGSDRLWQEVGALEIEPERIENLLYCGLDGSDRPALIAEDNIWLSRHTPQPRRRWNLWGRRRQSCRSGIGISTAAGSGAQLSTR